MASNNFQFPPLDYTLLLPDLVNFHMQRNSHFPIFVYSNRNLSNTLTEISFLEFGRACHRVGHALRPSRQGSDGEVVMVIANTDTILYHAILVGLSIAGWVPFPVSPRNSSIAVADMMKRTNCSRIVTLNHVHKALIDCIRSENEGVIIYELPALQYAFPRLSQEVSDDPFVPYPPPLQHPDLDSPAIYLHSSGSTGFPKPIPHSHRLQIQWLAQPLNRLYRELPSPRRIGSMAPPPCHIFGIVTQLYVPIACLVTTVVYPPLMAEDPFAQPVMPTSDNMIDCIKQTGCSIIFTVPTFLEHMARSKEAIDVLKKLDAVHFGGGPLPVKAGDTLWAAGVQLSHTYGATESGVPVAMAHKKDISDGDWVWLRFSDDLKTRWVPQGDDSYELEILSTENRQMPIENLPDARGYATGDLFVKHPTKDLWKIIGRVDDVIMLASGEKTVPAQMESVIGSSPLVQGVVMFGRERNQVGVLVEPRLEHAVDIKDQKAVAEFRNRIWPVIEEANRTSPAFSRIFKEMILIVTQGKPMSRAPKGTVQRKATLQSYEKEIDALYDVVEASLAAPSDFPVPSAWDRSHMVAEWLLEHARAISLNTLIDPRIDLFSQGFDSLSATYLRNKLLGALRKSIDPEIRKAATRIPPNFIFQNPTIQLLSVRIAALVNNNDAGQPIDSIQKHKQLIDDIIQKHAIGLDGPVDGILPCHQRLDSVTVLLTGTTGGLGSFLLFELLKNPSVERVFAFNRPSIAMSIENRQQSAFREKGLPTNILNSAKLVYVEADASLEKCGLSPAQYNEIKTSVTTIIHNAWRLDFNLTISSFEDNIRATRNLVDLGLDSPQKSDIRFLFTSSISSAQSWKNSTGPLLEKVQLDPSIATGTGYGESKYAAERIIAMSGLHATSLRISQITGGPGGYWTTTDWFPILVQSSIALGAFPDAIGLVSWLRIQEVATAILELTLAPTSLLPVLNMVNPRNVSWADVISFVRRSIIRRKMLEDDDLPIIPFSDWFTLLERRAEDTSEDDMEKVPALKLLEFFRNLAWKDGATRSVGNSSVTEALGMPTCNTVRTQQASPTMANMQAIGETDVDGWVEYWFSKGIL